MDVNFDDCRTQIKVGTILHCYVKDTNPPKNKFLVIVGKTSPPTSLSYATVFINTNPNIFNGRSQLQAYCSNYTFLSHDSFFDCSRISERSESEICAILNESSNSCLRGLVSENDLNSIIKILNNQLPQFKLLRYSIGA